ncbi:hypothetical protein V500_02740 [Pseudogymnoascus sp. VKM F-4518 (FW-2643)]|nr:hypothetical protein V500_02740 [Pseudogymnoascus sp. VKM F-4518 (FW-2643)]
MDFDDLALSRHDNDRIAWNQKLSRVGPAVCQLASKFRDNRPCYVADLKCGSFNFCIKVQFEVDGEEWMLRFPIPGKVMFAEQKVRAEVATIRYIKEKTDIPVPTVIAYGMADDNPTGLGPFLITTFVKGTLLGEMLKADSVDDQGDKVLSSDIPDSTLEVVYRQIADIILELSEHNFDKIGSLSLNDDDTWSIGSGPLTLNSNELARCGDVHVESRVYSSAADYLLDIAEQNIIHLEKQRNSIDSAADARRKYTARHLFRAAVPSFVSRRYNQGPFKLFCDDFRPGNILVDDSFKITGIIDWEWCYAAPFQFAYSPPRWLLLKEPAYWNYNSDNDLLGTYLSKFDIFLRTLEEQEYHRKGVTGHSTDPSLSSLMRRSIADNTFWFHEAARDSFALDRIYWSRLDSFFSGPVRDQDEISDSVCQADIHKGLNAFIDREMEHLRQYKLELSIEEECEVEDDTGDHGNRLDQTGFQKDDPPYHQNHISVFLRVALPVTFILGSMYIVRQQPR